MLFSSEYRHCSTRRHGKEIFDLGVTSQKLPNTLSVSWQSTPVSRTLSIVGRAFSLKAAEVTKELICRKEKFSHEPLRKIRQNDPIHNGRHYWKQVSLKYIFKMGLKYIYLNILFLFFDNDNHYRKREKNLKWKWTSLRSLCFQFCSLCVELPLRLCFSRNIHS